MGKERPAGLNNSLHGLRFVAAFMVMLHHLIYPGDLHVKTWAGALGAGGYLGVTVFFVLSGFVISYKYWDDFERPTPSAYWHFMVRRFARIYPLYFVLLMILFYNLGVPHNLLMLLTMTQALSPPHYGDGIGQAWTLTVELMFYLVAPAIIFVGHWRKALWAAFIAAAMVAIYLQIRVRHIPDGHFVVFNTIAGRMVEFMLGVVAAQTAIVRRPAAITLKKLIGADIAIGCAFVGLCGLIGWYDVRATGVPSGDSVVGWALRDLFAVFCAFVVYRLMERSGPLYSFLGSRVMTAWGKYSYAIYLVHAGIIWSLVSGANFWLRVGLVMLIAQFFYLYVEEPCRRAVTSTLDAIGSMIGLVPSAREAVDPIAEVP